MAQQWQRRSSQPEDVTRQLYARRVNPWRTEAFSRLNESLVDVLGDKTAAELARLGLNTVADLMAHLPTRYVAGTDTTDLSTVQPGEDVALVARVRSTSIAPGRGDRDRLVAVLSDDAGNRLEATWFGRTRYVEHWQKSLSRGVKGIFVGKVGEFRGQLQMTNPDYVMLDLLGTIVGRPKAEKVAMAHQVARSGLVGIYRSSAKFPTWRIAECVQLVLHSLAGLPDPLPDWVRAELGLSHLLDALTTLHQPEDLEHIDQARERLKFDEALALQATMMMRRKLALTRVAEPIEPLADGLLAAFDARLPFELTEGQRRVGEEIATDLEHATPMQRLLQGEVGSGKTIVALRAMLSCVDAGRQAALLAPTEVLAGQHHDTFRAMLGELADANTLGAPDVATEVVLLTGSLSAAAKREAHARITSGAAGIVIGTHALLSEAVSFADLGLVVIDEQHRFGVEQRAALQAQAAVHPHVLVMTATPIPRSVAMTVFGDLEISTLTEIPAGRADVQTTVVATRTHPHWLERVWERVLEEVDANRQVFVVCPRITASEADVAPDNDPGRQPSATVDEVASRLRAGPLAGLRIEVLHGQLPTPEKTAVMARFVAGEVDVLVSTTVIEVGVDVPNAAVMVVLDADRFGISQLHQLRGRIGRGEHPGVCLLVTNALPDSEAADRLRAVASTRDGFELANVDLAQRREGNVLGAHQSGSISTLRLLRVLDDAELIEKAREVAARWGQRPDADDDPVLSDMARQTELAAQPDWMERN